MDQTIENLSQTFESTNQPFETINNEVLLQRTKNLVKDERRVQVEVLIHLKEIESRRLYLNLGYASLFDFVIKDLGYTESAGFRRIQAMRLLKAVPSIRQKISAGSLSLTAAAQIQTFIKQEEKQNGAVNQSIKANLVSTLENKSSREIEKHLLALRPVESVTTEKVRQVTETLTEIKLVIPEELKQTLDHLKLLLSHINPEMSYQELISYLANKTFRQLTHQNIESKRRESKPSDIKHSEIKKGESKKSQSKVSQSKVGENRVGQSKKDQIRKKENEKDLGLLSAPEVMDQRPNSDVSQHSNSRYISKKIKEAVWRRDQGCCTYISKQSGVACRSKFQLQLDHIKPLSLGGNTELSNLRLLCSQHNRWRNQFMT